MSLKKLLSLFMALAMCLVMLPFTAAVAGAEPFAAMTQAQRSAAIEELMDFSSRLGAMRTEYGADYSTKDASDPYATGRIIVKYRGELKTTGALAEVSGHNDWHVLQYANGELAQAACKQLAKMPGVEYAVPDVILHTEEVKGSFLSWGYNANNVDAGSYNDWLLAHYGSDVSNIPTVTVAVIDTGADSDHPFIMDRLVPGYDFSNNDADPEDDHYHGTHVSGTVIDGTLSNIKVMPIKVLDSTGYGETTTVVLGIEYAYLHGCDVINMSLGGDCDGLEGAEHKLMADAINAACDAGTVVCVAAGNESDNAMNHCPANVERAITVASITSDHELSYFSNYGDIVDIMAPGSEIKSSVPGGGYRNLSGTSMATPHVAAAAAMVKSFDPALGNDEIAAILKGAAVDIDITNAGAGMLNVTDLFKFDLIINAEGQNNHFTSTGVYPWLTEADCAYSGNSGRNNPTSSLVCRAELGAYQTVTFDYKVSSQPNADIFRFKANDTVLLEASGEQAWQTVTLVIPSSGMVTLSWDYIKDTYGSAGSDMAWVRNIRIESSVSSAANAPDSCILIDSNGAYPWTADEQEHAAVSGNAGVHGSSSSMTASVQLYAGMQLSFDYKVSSASGDVFTFAVNGQTVVTSGATSGYVHYTYTAPANGVYNLEFRYSKNASGSAGSDCAWVRGLSLAHTFATAANVNGASLPFVNNGFFPWVVYGDCIKSSNKGFASSESAFTLTLQMQAGDTLSFRYAASSEDNYDFFKFYADNAVKLTASGQTEWATYVFTAPTSKTYTFKWSYEKDYSVDYHEDCAFVDDIAFSGWHSQIMGDVDSNGVVNANDALAILRYSLGILNASQIDLAAADVNGDGTVNATDALYVMRAALGIIEM